MKVRKITRHCGFDWDNLYEYRGYRTIAEYDKNDRVWYGQVVNTRDDVSWETDTVDGIEHAFKKAVDDYIKYKKEVKQ